MLADLLKKYFDDPGLLKLYWKLVKAGYIEWDPANRRRDLAIEDLGVPQGGILSPLLSNVVLHELDKFVENLKSEQKEAVDSAEPLALKSNKEYQRISTRITKIRKQIDGLRLLGQPGNSRRPLSRVLSQLIRRRRQIPSTSLNPNYVKFDYVRYADDWIIGVWGPVSLALELKEKIRLFLETLKLELSLEKTLITSAYSGKARFLSTLIRVSSAKKNTRVTFDQVHKRTMKSPSGIVQLIAPIGHLVKRLQSKQLGFLPGSLNRIDYPKSFLALPIKDLIIRYRSILLGYLNYYSFADNRPRLRYVYNTLRRSMIGVIKNKLGCSARELRRFCVGSDHPSLYNYVKRMEL